MNTHPEIILHDQGPTVKYDENLLIRLDAEGVAPSDVVSTVQGLYPKFDKPLLSKCRHGDQYGVMLRPDALDAILTAYAPGLRNAPRRDVRTKTRRIQCRLSDTAYRALQRAISASGLTVQRWIEDMVLNLINQTSAKESEQANEARP